MLIHKIENTHFSASESIIIDFILKEGENIKNMTTSQIANATYTSPPLLVRVAKKLGFSGWNEFKQAYLDELNYLYANQDVDASIPFVVTDDMMKISKNIASLQISTINDTLSLLKHDDLQLALRYLRNTQEIEIYTSSIYIHLAHTFKQNMMLINHHVNLYELNPDVYVHVSMSTPQKCAILISYSGRRNEIIEIVKNLKLKKTPVIAITSIADNDLAQLADVTLRMSSREMINTKIGNFASTQSVKCLLDILYANIFAMNYTNNLDYRIEIGKQVALMTQNGDE